MSRIENHTNSNTKELVLWCYMRISGLILICMALFHFVLTHIINDVTETGALFVDERWSNPAWRFYDWLMLALALTHGMNGLRMIGNDMISQKSTRRAVFGVAGLIILSLGVFGTITIVTFQPQR